MYTLRGTIIPLVRSYRFSTTHNMTLTRPVAMVTAKNKTGGGGADVKMAMTQSAVAAKSGDPVYCLLLALDYTCSKR